MPNFSSDILIKLLRKQKGLTQKELADGICAQDTLSRIERGERKPDWHTFEKLLQRLGEDPGKYYTDVISSKDKYLIDTKDTITNLIRSKKFDDVQNIISKLEHDEAFQEPLQQQFIIRAKAGLAHAVQDYKTTYDYAIKAIKITKPDFCEDKIDGYILFYDEIMLINLIAASQARLTSLEKSTDIYLRLKASIDKTYVDGDEKAKTYLSLLYNISKNFCLLKRYDEDIQICDEGLDYCTIHRNSHFRPLFLFDKSYAFLYLGRMEEGTELLKTTYSLFQGLERYDELNQAKEFVEKEFNIII